MDRKTGLLILQDLISIDTVNPPGNELPAAEYLAGLLTPWGFRCDIQRLGQGRANLLAELGSGSGPVLLLCGHLDVVPASGPWTKNPFMVNIEGSRAYGRGVADMKGGIASMCEAAIKIAEEGGPVTGTLKLVFVADEEDANLGMRAFLETGQRADYAVIGEPTNLEVAVAHRGVSRDIIEVHGCARHAALAEEEESAVSKLPAVIQSVDRMNQELESRRHPVLPPPSIALTMVNAYEKDNIVPGTVCLLTDFRILPGTEKEDARTFLLEGLSKSGVEDVTIKNHFFMKGGEILPGDPFVQICCETGGKVLGRDLKPQAFSASCEQCFLEDAGIKTVIFGPGAIEQAHTVDEYLDMEQLDGAALFYERLAREILG